MRLSSTRDLLLLLCDIESNMIFEIQLLCLLLAMPLEQASRASLLYVFIDQYSMRPFLMGPMEISLLSYEPKNTRIILCIICSIRIALSI